MTLEELIRRFRVAAGDKTAPYLFPDEDVTDWLNDAQEQACIRARLLREDANTDVTRITLSVGTHTYRLHESLYEIIALNLIQAAGGDPVSLVIKSREWLDANMPRWRFTEDPARYVIQDETSIRVVGTFAVGDRIDMECYRLPLEPMANDADEPEIHRAAHVHLIDWALHRAFSVPDAEGFDATRSQKSETDFTAYFGPLPDADMRRITRHDVEHHNYTILP
jgi:hypothetical protein